MQRLRAEAEAHSGVPYSAVEEARAANLYARLGADTFTRLSAEFYARVYGDEAWFRALFANTTQEAAARNQREFLTQEFGGPPLYRARKGCTSLLARHGPYAVTHAARHRWLAHMEGACRAAVGDEQCFALLMAYFRHMAAFVVVGRELVNPARTVGYYGVHREGET